MENRDSSTSSAAQPDTHLDQLLNKYVSVWLWSILFGTTTGVLYSFLSFRYDRWGGLGLILIIPALASLMLAILSWLRLYHALAGYLIPRFILNESHEEEADPRFFAYQIRRAFLYFVYAAAFRAVASLLELALASSNRMG
jgi:hypothetical protein